MLANLGHDVLSARDHAPHASDEALLALARAQGRVLIRPARSVEPEDE